MIPRVAAAGARRRHPLSRGFLRLNAVGGACVLASYVWGLSALASSEPGLWGGVPVSWRPAYTLNMVLAAVGYFPFTSYSWTWWAIRLDLALVAIGSLGVLAALLTLETPPAPRWRRVAIAGCVPFALQTVVLDAALWPALFAR